MDFTGQMIQTNVGSFLYEDIVNQILARYAEGKNPALAVKTAIQLGIPADVIMTLPGVTQQAFNEGSGLIESGAFAETATGTQADAQQAAAVGSDQYNARIAAGLDAFGFPPEEVAQLTAAGLYGPGKQYDPGTSGGLFSSVSPLESLAQETLSNSGKANDTRYADSIVGTFNYDGKTYNVQGDGSFTTISETPDNVATTTTFTPTGQEVGTYVDDRFQTTGLDRFLEVAANAAIAAGTAAGLGPAGAGLFGVPGAAAAAGAGSTNLLRTGSVEDALKAAALGGATAYGIGELTNLFSDVGGQAAADLTIADDIAQLSKQGLSPDQIAQTVSQGYGIDPFTAAEAVSSALSSSAGSVAPGAVEITSSSLFDPASLASPLVSNLASLVGGTPQVEVTGQTFQQPQGNTPEISAAITAALPVATGGTTQQVEVTGQNQPKTPDLNSTAGAAAGTIIPGITPSIPTATDKVEVTAPREKTNISIPSVSGAALGSVLTPSITNPIPKPQQPTTKKEDPFAKLFTPNNLLSLLSLFGAGAASKAGAGGSGSVNPGDIPRSNPLNYGDDYYNRVQQYYNSYMPEYPRDVATPLREWYGNGTGNGTAMPGQSTGMPSNAVSSPSSVVGSLFGSMEPQSAKQSSENAYSSFVANEKALLNNPQYGGQFYGEGLTQLGGLPAGLSKEALSKLFPNGTSAYIPQEVSVSIPDYFGYINNNPEFNSLFEKARASQRAFSRAGADPAQQEYEMKNYLNNLAGGLPYTGGVNQGAKPLLPLLTSLDTAQGRLTSDQADALAFIVNNAENYNRLKQDIPVWEKEGNTAYLTNQVPYFNQLETALKDYSKKLAGLDVSKLSSKELFSLIPSGI